MIQSKSSLPNVQALFAEGLQQLYGFNSIEAQRNFKAALQLDPDCLLCYWALAW